MMSRIIKNLCSFRVVNTRNLLHFKQTSASRNVCYARTLLPNNYALFLSRSMAQTSIKNIGIGELKDYQKCGTLIIDVRELNEIAETGVLPGGINIPLGDIPKALCKTPEEFKATYYREKPDKDTEIVFSCRSGKRSSMACQKAAELGFNNVINFQGGWLEWEKQTKE